MANFGSPVTTYSDTTPQVRVITDVITLIDPSDAPMVMALGGLDGASGKFTFTGEPGKVVEWLEDTLTPLTATLNGSITTTTTAITIATADIQSLQKGHILEIGSEQVYVASDPDRTNATCQVTRAFAGTTAASAASNASVTIVGLARLEGDDSTSIGYTDRYVGSNFTQIFHQEVKVTRTQRQISQYGIADELAYQSDKVVPSQMRLIERHTFKNKAASAGSASTPRVMGGFQNFVTTNKQSGASLAQSQFEAAIKLAYASGGSGPWLAFCSPTNLAKVKALYDNSNYLRVDRTETTMGMVIESILTPYGQVNLVLDRWATDTEIALIDVKHAGFYTLYPFTQEPLAKVGDSDRAEVIGEFTLCLRQEKAHALLTAVS